MTQRWGDVAVAQQMRVDAAFVLTSGFINADVRAQAGQMGVTHLIYKPADGDELCDAIARASESRRSASQTP